MWIILSRLVLSNWKPILIGLVIGVVLGSVYIKGRNDGAAKVQLAWDLERIEQEKAIEAKKEEIRKFVDDQSRRYEGRIARLNKLTDALNQKLETEIAKNDVYRTCVLPADGVQLLRNAATAP